MTSVELPSPFPAGLIMNGAGSARDGTVEVTRHNTTAAAITPPDNGTWVVTWIDLTP